MQKRVGCRLQNLKKKEKGLGGKGILTDRIIDKLQNYCGIAIRSNQNKLKVKRTIFPISIAQLDQTVGGSTIKIELTVHRL